MTSSPAALVPLAMLPGTVLLLQPRLPAWVFMWVMAASLYAGCKWITYCDARDRGIRGRSVADARLPARLARDGCRDVPSAERERSRPAGVRVDRSGAQNRAWRLSYLGRRRDDAASPSDPCGLDCDGRPDLRPALRHVPPALADVAQPRRCRHADHAESAGLDVARRVLGTALEHRVSRAGFALHVPAASIDRWSDRRDAAGVPHLRPRPRAGHLRACARRIWTSDDVLRRAGAGARRRARPIGTAPWTGTRPARLALHSARHRRTRGLALSAPVRAARHPADVVGYRRHVRYVMTINLTVLLQVAAVLHIGLMCAGLLMPKVVGMRAHLEVVPPFIRHLFWVYYTFIGLSLLAFSAITFAFADTLAAGSGLARALCTFLAVFWTVRLLAATFVFDMRPYLTTGARRLGYHVLNVAFAYLPIVYALAAAQPRWLR